MREAKMTDSVVVRMTRKGRRLVKAGKFPPDLSPMGRLVAAIAAMTDESGISGSNMCGIVNEILERHKTYDAAIDAVLSGCVSLDKTLPN
jgi:hypothetical protein